MTSAQRWAATAGLWSLAAVIGCIEFAATSVPTMQDFDSNFLSASTPAEILVFSLFVALCSACTLRWKSYLPMYAVGILGLSQFAVLYPNYVHANVYFHEGSALSYIVQNGRLSSYPQSNFLNSVNFLIPGTAYFVAALTMVLGVPSLFAIPLTNLIFVAIWFLFLPLTVQIRMRSAPESRYLAFVLFWIIMMTGYVLYEQGLIDHQFAEVLFAVFLLALSFNSSLKVKVPVLILFTAMVVTHVILAGLALGTVVLFEMLNSRGRLRLEGLSLPCAIIFVVWYGYDAFAGVYLLQGIQGLTSLLQIGQPNDYLLHAATSAPAGADLLVTVSSTATKAVIYCVLGLFAWISVRTLYRSIRDRRTFWPSSAAAGLATVGLLLFFLSSPSTAYGFADRWLWVAPLAFPVALIDGRAGLKPLRRLLPLAKSVAPLVFALTILSLLTISTSLYWQPVSQQSTEAGFIASRVSAASVDAGLGPVNPVAFYLSISNGLDPPGGFGPFSLGNVPNFGSTMASYLSQRLITLVSAYDLNLDPNSTYAYTQSIPSHSTEFYSDGLMDMYLNPLTNAPKT